MARRWGWIPNLSGVAFDYESIRERLDSDAVRGSTWIHIQASPGPGDTVLINVVRTLSDDDSESSRCGKEGDVLWNHIFHLVDPRDMLRRRIGIREPLHHRVLENRLFKTLKNRYPENGKI